MQAQEKTQVRRSRFTHLTFSNLKLTDPEFKAIKRVCVDELQFAHQSNCKLHHAAHMRVGHLNFL